ncbi:hypothetical protein FACS1894137_17140 [Spirochaetia bacterium]|nr:hypothetical protein FACS1894137_17140 [Spirochaetia bacterium]
MIRRSNIVIFYLCLLLLNSCSSQQGKKTENNDNVFAVNIINKTLFDIEIIDDSRIVSPGTEKRVLLPVFHNELQDGYGVNYRVNLLSDIFITYKRNENIIINAGQDTAIIEAPVFDRKESFIILNNTGTQTISMKNDVGYMNGLIQGNPQRQYGSPYTKPKAQSLYDNIPSNAALFIETDQYKTIPFPFTTFSPGHIYSFTFDGSAVALTDARPLHRIGETAWAKPFPEAVDLPQLINNDDGTIASLVPTKDGTVFYSFGSNGEEIRHTQANQDAPGNVTSVMMIDSGSLLVAGYTTDSRGLDSPIVQKLNRSGVLQWALPPSTQYPYANLLTAAAKTGHENTWLVAGQQNTAYIREIRDEGAAAVSSWELGRRDLDPKCGAVYSAMYDAERDLWRVCGALAESGGSYIIELSGGGKVQRTDTSLNNFLFYKILGGADGSYYLIGEELKAEDSYAVIVKYDAAGKELWRERNQAPKQSYYQDAVPDEDHGQIVLAGTMNAGTGSGEGGTPFVQGIGINSGAMLWRQELKADEFRGTALAGGIVKAPDYGYVLSLCGINRDSPVKPFIIARVNERGL